MKPPAKVQLPGGRIVELRAGKNVVARRKPGNADMLFAGARALFSEDVEIRDKRKRVDVASLTLAEFHALRAIATHVGWIEEEEVEIACRNCDAKLAVKPCAAMPIGPFVDAELDDDEYDALLDVSVAHEILALGREIRFVPITVGDATPLHRALACKELDVTPEVAAAMGIASLDRAHTPKAISRALTRCDDRAFGEITNLFLEAHYPLRLGALVICKACGTRNDVDAPYDREFPLYEDLPAEAAGPFLTFDEFDALAQRIAEPLVARASGPNVMLVVEGGVPATDDGGEPLLGSYVPGHEGDARSHANPGEITVYYRTFAAMWKDDGAYDVEAELEETIEHELEHHEAHLVGHDAKDDEERDEIAREARRVIGKKALVRASANAFASDVGEFWKRTWLVWVVALIAVVFAIVASR